MKSVSMPASSIPDTSSFNAPSSTPSPTDALYVIGVDVGTHSCRAGLLNAANGVLLHTYSLPLHLHHPAQQRFVYSSAHLWRRVCLCVHRVVAQARSANLLLTVEQIRGIAFDATCSLVVLGKDAAGRALSVEPDYQQQEMQRRGQATQSVISSSLTSKEAVDEDSDTEQEDDTVDVIAWLDHRAVDEASVINATKHPSLRYVGNAISCEMELPKLLWLKRHLRSVYDSADLFFDLVDFLSFRATGRQGCY